MYPKIDNFLVDSGADWASEAEWLTYITRLSEKEQDLWTRNSPVAYNRNFPNVVWADGSITKIPVPRKVFRWLDWKTNEEYV